METSYSASLFSTRALLNTPENTLYYMSEPPPLQLRHTVPSMWSVIMIIYIHMSSSKYVQPR